MRKVLLGVLLVLSFIASNVWAADTYKIDPAHTNLSFTATHMMVSKVTGDFGEFDGHILYDPKDLVASKIDMTIQVASINTRNEKRDAHLKSPDFFDVEKFPTITFVTKAITPAQIVGDLTIKGVTKQVTIPATIAGPVKTPFGTTVIGINGALTINRQDYGVNWNKTLDQGGVAVSDDVAINVSIEASKVEEAQTEAVKK